MVPDYNIRKEISPQYLRYWHQYYQQNLPDRLWYILICIQVPMMYACRLYCLSTYRYTCRMIIIIKSDNDWYEVICYVQNKMLYSRIYLSTYDVRVQIILPNPALVHIQDDNNELVLLPYLSTLYAIYGI